MNENVNYHPLRRCVICNELVEADDPTCAVCGQPACSDHAYDVGGGEWYCADCCHGKLTCVRTVVRHPIGGARIAANGFAKTIRHSSRFKVRNSILFSATTAIMIYVGN